MYGPIPTFFSVDLGYSAGSLGYTPLQGVQFLSSWLKAVREELGHEIRVFLRTVFEAIPSKLPSANHEEDDDFYELQPADYFNLILNRMAEQSKMLKTRKMREAELAARRAKITKAVMRVRFPDGYILEADFLPTERIHSLVDLLMKVLARPDLPVLSLRLKQSSNDAIYACCCTWLSYVKKSSTVVVMHSDIHEYFHGRCHMFWTCRFRAKFR
ncbi:plant UBX domain-containing protein 1-like isoform X2 [Phragmites australis]|uniref:plant UBX domain-containing protein 1-like isoform X2 n=1 Tax=Phragmites australis TaxID=29695 RepID=UPI002D77FEB7|nr:plant UBX domain-containing protein 1-like isoform X2 [Phragmites australis]